MYFDYLKFGIFDAMVFSACLSCTTHWQISTCPMTPRCKTFSSFLISARVFLCTELIFNYALVVPMALNLPMASKFGSIINRNDNNCIVL